MIEYLVLAAGLLGANVEGRTNRDIQAAVDRAAAQGGGEVVLAAGTYDMDDSLHLRSHVRIRGQGDKTVLRKRPSVTSPLSADLGYGHFNVSLAEPGRFHVGMGVHIHDDHSGGFYDTVATLTWREGDRFGISRMLNHDYGRRANAAVTSIYPVISGYHLEDAAVEDLAIDGNKSQNAHLNGCRGGGVFLLQAHQLKLKGLHVKDYNGDGISFQQCRGTVVERCVLEGMTGLGLHPGSGSVGTVLRGNACRRNGSDGIYYCLRVSYSLCENNTDRRQRRIRDLDRRPRYRPPHPRQHHPQQRQGGDPFPRRGPGHGRQPQPARGQRAGRELSQGGPGRDRGPRRDPRHPYPQ